jgi:hypothetical protein
MSLSTVAETAAPADAAVAAARSTDLALEVIDELGEYAYLAVPAQAGSDIDLDADRCEACLATGFPARTVSAVVTSRSAPGRFISRENACPEHVRPVTREQLAAGFDVRVEVPGLPAAVAGLAPLGAA